MRVPAAKRLREAFMRLPEQDQAAVVQFMGLATMTKPKPKPKAWKVGCAYGSPDCKGRKFLPHGTGSTHHTSCEEGRAALAALAR